MWPNGGYGGGFPGPHPSPFPPAPGPPPPFPPDAGWAHWAQWDSHFNPVLPSTRWHQEAAGAPRPGPYDRPYVPRDYSGPNAHTMRGSEPSVPRPPPPNSWRDPGPAPPFDYERRGPLATTLASASTHAAACENGYVPQIDMHVEVASTQLEVTWKHPEDAGKLTYDIRVCQRKGEPYTIEYPGHFNRHTLRVSPGEWYKVEVFARKANTGIVVAEGAREVKAVFSRAEMDTLHKKAIEFTGTRAKQFQILYRCKPKPYWDDIHHNCNGIMEKYMKDDNGQPANSINGVISGLFFSARLLPNGELPASSPFGNVRMLVKAFTLLDPDRVNLYFADFYCNYTSHYVTVIVAVKGSETDQYCAPRLILLDAQSNPFLRYECRPPSYDFTFFAASTVWVEILYTESVPIAWGRFDKIQAVGHGTSKIGGLPNNKECVQCNLYPVPPRGSRGATSSTSSGGGASTSSSRVDPKRGPLQEKTNSKPSSSSSSSQAGGQLYWANRRSRSPSRDRDGRGGEGRRDGSTTGSTGAKIPEGLKSLLPPPVDKTKSTSSPSPPMPSVIETGANSTFQTLLNMKNTRGVSDEKKAGPCDPKTTSSTSTMTTNEIRRPPGAPDAPRKIELVKGGGVEKKKKKDKKKMTSHDYPGWTDLIECVCEAVDAVCEKEQSDIQGETDPIIASQRRIDAALAEMEERLRDCKESEVLKSAAVLRQIVANFKAERAEVAREIERRECARRMSAMAGGADQRSKITSATPPTSKAPPTCSTVTSSSKRRERKKAKAEEEDLDEYLDDGPGTSGTVPPEDTVVAGIVVDLSAGAKREAESPPPVVKETHKRPAEPAGSNGEVKEKKAKEETVEEAGVQVPRETAKVEETKVASSKGEEAKVAPPKTEETKVELPKSEDAKVQPPKTEVELPKSEETKVEPPKTEQGPSISEALKEVAAMQESLRDPPPKVKVEDTVDLPVLTTTVETVETAPPTVTPVVESTVVVKEEVTVVVETVCSSSSTVTVVKKEVKEEEPEPEGDDEYLDLDGDDLEVSKELEEELLK